MDAFVTDCLNTCGIDTSGHCNYTPLGGIPQYQNCAGNSEFDAFTNLCEMCQDGIPLLQYGCDLGIAGGLVFDGFEVKDLSIETKDGFNTTIKNLLFYKNNPIIETGILTHDGDGVRWGEQTTQFPETVITVAVVDGDTDITVEDTSRFTENSTIKIRVRCPGTCCRATIDAIVDTVDHANSKLVLQDPIVLPTDCTDLPVDTRVIRITKLYNCCDEPEVNQYLEYTKYYKTYYQWFAGAFDLEVCDINKCFANKQDSMDKLKYNQKTSFADTLYDILGAKRFGLNIPFVANQQSSQTMGIISSIQYYHDQFKLDNIHSLRNIKSNTTKALALFLILEKSVRCHVVGGSKSVHVACTEEFYQSLRFLAPYFTKLMGCNSICDKNEAVGFEIRELNIAGGSVMFYIDPYLAWVFKGESKAVYMPADQYAVFTPKYLQMDNNGDLMKADMSFYLEYNWINNIGKIGSCGHKFIYYNQMAFLPMGITTCSWGIIEDLWMDGITPGYGCCLDKTAV